MPRKPNSMYRQISGQAYTRKQYMGGVPQIRISAWDVGDLRTRFPLKVHLIAKEPCQIRHIALEAARISANRYIAKQVGNAYHLKLRLYPHNVLRENKIATGAGADRICQGVRGASLPGEARGVRPARRHGREGAGRNEDHDDRDDGSEPRARESGPPEGRREAADAVALWRREDT